MPLRKKPSKKAKQEAPAQPRRGGAPIIELDDVTKVYPGGHLALERVSLALNRGEFLFLVGPHVSLWRKAQAVLLNGL